MEISIKGEKRGLLWGLNAIDKFCNIVELDLDAAMQLIFNDAGANTTEALKQTIAFSKLTACAVSSYDRVNNTGKPEVKYEEVLDFFDQEGATTMHAILNDFLQSKFLGNNVGDYLGVSVKNAEEDKKKESLSA